jgi:drug/metabolite transporter (DMT)-like permease
MVLTRLDLGRSGLTVFDITAIRFGTAGFVLLPIILQKGAFARSVGLGGTGLMVLGAGAPYALIAAAGLLYAPAAHAGALIPGVMPLFAALLSFLLLRDRIARDRLFGLGLIPFGVLLVAGSNLFGPIGPQSFGHLLFLFAALMWASYTVTLKRSGVAPLHGAAIVAFWSALLFLPVYLIAPISRGIMQAGLMSVAVQVVFQGILTSVVSLVAFNKAVEILGASRGAIFASLVPSLAALFAIPVLGEIPTLFETAGIAVITLGVLLGSGALGGIFAARALRARKTK